MPEARRVMDPAPTESSESERPESTLPDTDEAAASAARVKFRDHGLEPLAPDESIRDLLRPGEDVLAIRHCAALDRRVGSMRASAIDSIRGDLYVTTARLVHVGQQVVTFDLDEIQDSALAGETLLLVLGSGVGIALNAERPRLLRVQIAAARAARAGTPEPPPEASQSRLR